MAARTKQITIDGFPKVFTVRELTVAELMELFDSMKNLDNDASVMDMFTTASDKLGMFGTAKMEDLKVMAPSEIETLYDGFMEVNNSFFKVARTLGMESLLDRVRAAFLEDFYELFVSVMQKGSPEPSITPTDTLKSS